MICVKTNFQILVFNAHLHQTSKHDLSRWCKWALDALIWKINFFTGVAQFYKNFHYKIFINLIYKLFASVNKSMF